MVMYHIKISDNMMHEEHLNFNFWKRDAKKFGMTVVHEQKTSKVGKPLFEEVEVWFAEDANKKCRGIFFKGGGTNYGHLIHEKEEETPQYIIEAFSNIDYRIGDMWFFEESIIDESLDYKIPNLHDVTEFARKNNPENFMHDDEDGISDKKIEYSPDTNEVITTYRRNGAWEIHHQGENEQSGVKLNKKNPPMKFASHMFNWIKDKVSNGQMVRVVGTDELIHGYHKVANKLAPHIGDNIHVGEIMPSFNQKRDGIPVHEFLIHRKGLLECFGTPYSFRVPHLRYEMLKEEFADSPFIKEYEEKLRKQGHDV